MPVVRCFVGVEPSEALAQDLNRCGEAIRTAEPGWRNEKWVPTSNLHLTLHFIGNVEEEGLEDLGESLEGVVASAVPFDLPFLRLRATPRTSKARMLWAQYDDPGYHCAELARAVADVADRGVADSSRPFIPHVTVCRARIPQSIAPDTISTAHDVLATRDITMSVAWATLFSSRLTPRGPDYEVIGRWRMRGQ